MANIIVAFPKMDDAKKIRALLMKNGFRVALACTTGAQVLSAIDDFHDGIVICSYKLVDMHYEELLDCLTPGFDMLLMAGQSVMGECVQENVVKLPMPLKVHELMETLEMMQQTQDRRRRKQRRQPRERNEQEVTMIQEAKELLMNRNKMSEEEAHRYIQKCSMDSSTNMVETAQMILTMMRA